jgi:hypothetical protein
VNATTDHAIRLMTPPELLAYKTAGWTLCKRDGCDGDAVYYATRRNAHGTWVRERICVAHAAGYATRHGLVLPPLPQRPTDHAMPLPATVVARCADTNSSHGVS